MVQVLFSPLMCVLYGIVAVQNIVMLFYRYVNKRYLQGCIAGNLTGVLLLFTMTRQNHQQLPTSTIVLQMIFAFSLSAITIGNYAFIMRTKQPPGSEVYLAALVVLVVEGLLALIAIGISPG